MTIRTRLFVGLLGVALLSTILSACFKEKLVLSPASIVFADLPYDNLSDYGFFIGEISELVPNEGVLLYEPRATLFTDYASKSRYVWMPEGVSAVITKEGEQFIEFPDKSILIKNFYYTSESNGSKNIVETRLMVKDEGEWQAYPYLWNEEQNDAAYKITGKNIPMSVTDLDGLNHDITYIQPNKNQCKSCHNQNEALKPIGPKARTLNFALDYGSGEKMNQLEKWADMGYLSGFSSAESYPVMTDYNDVSAPIHARATSYLDANCGHCHSESGPASTSGLFMSYGQENMSHWGLNKTPIAAGKGSGGLDYDIKAGSGAESIIHYRMNSIEPGVMMAELGRSMIHKEGVALIQEWIDGMDTNGVNTN